MKKFKSRYNSLTSFFLLVGALVLGFGQACDPLTKDSGRGFDGDQGLSATKSIQVNGINYGEGDYGKNSY